MDWLPPIGVSRISGGKVISHKELFLISVILNKSKKCLTLILFSSSYRKKIGLPHTPLHSWSWRNPQEACPFIIA
jgi:hypothetical protein